jgi:hypothetical protein
MRLRLPLLAASLLALAAPALADRYTAAPHPPAEAPPPQPPANAAALAREQRLLALLTPAVREWVAAAGPRQSGEGDTLAAAKSTVQRRYPDLFGPADLAAMTFLVLMSAGHAADEDLRRQMAQIEAQRRASDALLQAHGSKDARAVVRKPGALSPEEQIRLQPYVTRKDALERAAAGLMDAPAEPNAQVLAGLK